MQESWIKILRGIDGFRGGTRACYWVRAIVANSAKDIRRRRFRETASPDAEYLAPDPSPEDLAISRHEVAVLRELTRRLPEAYREVIQLRLEQGLSTDETATRLGISRSSTATRLNRGLRELRKRFEARTRQRTRSP